MRPVTVQYLKYPDRPHWRLDLVHLGDDEYGTWLGGPVPTVVQRGAESPIVFEVPFVQLIPRQSWWALLVNDPWYKIDLYVDIATPARWEAPGRVTLIDLDLDVVRRRNGAVEILDEDEFLDHQVRFAYPPELIQEALTAATEVRRAIEAQREPFGRAGESWLAKLEALAAAPGDSDL